MIGWSGNIVSVDSQTATDNSGWMLLGGTGSEKLGIAFFRAVVTTDNSSGTTPTLDIVWDVSYDSSGSGGFALVDGLSQFTGDSTQTFIQRSDTVSPLPPYHKVTWTIGGTTPSFDVDVWVTVIIAVS